MSEWKEYKLGEIISLHRGYDLPSSQRKKGTIPIVSSSGISDYHDSYKMLPPGVVTGRYGTIGEVFFLNEPYWPLNTTLYIDDFKGNDPLFIYYFLKSFDFEKFNDKSTIPGINRNHLYGEVVKIPSLDEQKRIASILSSLDDKIDLLNRENATLEAMAETLFRQWFIEEAKEDWEEKPLSSIATFLNGLACQKYPPKDEIEKLPVLKIRELTNGIGADSDWATTDVGDEYIVHAGDVIFAWSASLMVKIWDGEDCILNQHLFKVTSDNYPKWFYFFWCKHHLNEFISIAQSHATTMGHIKRGDLDTAMVVMPSDDEIRVMTAQMNGLLQKIENNSKQVNTLILSRDGLLPRLMSNELTI